MLIDEATATAEGAEATPRPAPEQVENALERLTRLLGLPVVCCDARTGARVASADTDLLPAFPPDLLRHCAESQSSVVVATSQGLAYFAVPLFGPTCDRLVACGYVVVQRGLRPPDLVLAAADAGWTARRLDDWLNRLPVCDPRVLERLLALAAGAGEQARHEAESRDDYARIAEQLDYTYEELNLLHTLTQSMHISQSPRQVAGLSLERISAVIQAEGHAIWLDDKREGRMFLIEGQLPFDEMGMARMIARFDAHAWPRPLVRNHVAGTRLGADIAGLRNFALVAIADGNLRFGWICSCNITGGQSFGSVQTSLLSSVASILGTHQHNLELYRQHEDLLLGFVRSLVSTLDAKDAYTRGHSDRVAMIARRLGAHLGLPPEDLRDIYLSGLLHDIGKIGVDDHILRKSGPLTRDEFEQVKKHPVIGYSILAGLRNLHAVLPGVRHHHESYAGTGYPDGLKGEEIPLMARIIAVADSFDAMSSDRPYRHGLKLETLEQIFRDGAGRQWDASVVAAYFEMRDEILKICQSYSPRHGNLLGDSSDDTDLGACENDPLQTIDDIRNQLRSATGP